MDPRGLPEIWLRLLMSANEMHALPNNFLAKVRTWCNEVQQAIDAVRREGVECNVHNESIDSMLHRLQGAQTSREEARAAVPDAEEFEEMAVAVDRMVGRVESARSAVRNLLCLLQSEADAVHPQTGTRGVHPAGHSGEPQAQPQPHSQPQPEPWSLLNSLEDLQAARRESRRAEAAVHHKRALLTALNKAVAGGQRACATHRTALEMQCVQPTPSHSLSPGPTRKHRTHTHRSLSPNPVPKDKEPPSQGTAEELLRLAERAARRSFVEDMQAGVADVASGSQNIHSLRQWGDACARQAVADSDAQWSLGLAQVQEAEQAGSSALEQAKARLEAARRRTEALSCAIACQQARKDLKEVLDARLAAACAHVQDAMAMTGRSQRSVALQARRAQLADVRRQCATTMMQVLCGQPYSPWADDKLRTLLVLLRGPVDPSLHIRSYSSTAEASAVWPVRQTASQPGQSQPGQAQPAQAQPGPMASLLGRIDESVQRSLFQRIDESLRRSQEEGQGPTVAAAVAKVPASAARSSSVSGRVTDKALLARIIRDTSPSRSWTVQPGKAGQPPARLGVSTNGQAGQGSIDADARHGGSDSWVGSIHDEAVSPATDPRPLPDSTSMPSRDTPGPVAQVPGGEEHRPFTSRALWQEVLGPAVGVDTAIGTTGGKDGPSNRTPTSSAGDDADEQAVAAGAATAGGAVPAGHGGQQAAAAHDPGVAKSPAAAVPTPRSVRFSDESTWQKHLVPVPLPVPGQRSGHASGPRAVDGAGATAANRPSHPWPGLGEPAAPVHGVA